MAEGASATNDEPDDELLPEELLGTVDGNPRGLGLLALWREDLRVHGGDLLCQGFWALAVHRFGNWKMRCRVRALRLPLSVAYLVLMKIVQWSTGIEVHYWVKVGRRVRLWHHSGIILGARQIGNDVQLHQNTTLGSARTGDRRTMKPILEDRVTIGPGVVVLGPIRIGHDSVIGANAVVLTDVPPFSVVAGVPARVIGSNRE